MARYGPCVASVSGFCPFNVVFSRFIHVVASVVLHSFLRPSNLRLDRDLFIRSSGHPLAVVNAVPMDMQTGRPNVWCLWATLEEEGLSWATC